VPIEEKEILLQLPGRRAHDRRSRRGPFGPAPRWRSSKPRPSLRRPRPKTVAPHPPVTPPAGTGPCPFARSRASGRSGHGLCSWRRVVCG